MKTPAELSVDFPRAIVMEAAKCEAVVNQQVIVSHVERVETDRKALAEILADAQIELSVSRQIGIGVLRVGRAVNEAGAVVEVRSEHDATRQGRVKTSAEGVALIVIEGPPVWTIGKAHDQTSGERTARLRHL